MMWFSNFMRWGVLLLAFGLLGCEGQKSVTNLNNTFNFRSNAFLAAFQDGNGAWELAYTDNEKNDQRQRNYSLESQSGQYAVMYVCKSKFDGRNHEIYIYYLTVDEMRVSTHTCRVAEAKRQLFNVSGPVLKSVDGSPPGSDALAQEMTMLAFSRSVNMRAYEGFAARFAGAEPDILGYKGPLLADNTIQPQYYYRASSRFSGTVNSFTVDFNRNVTDIPNKKVISAAGMTPVDVDIVGKAADESLVSVFGFGSVQETFLPIVGYVNREQFQVTGAPPAFFNVDTYGEPVKEGHELHVTATNASGVERKLVSFFNQPQNMTLYLPAVPSGTLLLSGEDGTKTLGLGKVEVRHFQLTLPEYSDPHYGTASLYEVDLRGTSSYSGPPRIQWPLNSDPPTYVIVPTELEYHLYVSRGWLEANGSRQIKLPDFSALQGWDYDWDYLGGSQGQAALNIYATDQAAGPLLLHLQDGEYINGAAFGKVQQSVSSLPTVP